MILADIYMYVRQTCRKKYTNIIILCTHFGRKISKVMNTKKIHTSSSVYIYKLILSYLS